ncbi:hypothetical protein MAR_012948, partial [Mya arenaria]
MIESQPPVWQSNGPVSSKTPYGYLGEFRAGNVVNVPLEALDPEGLNVTYTLVAGSLPPGLKLGLDTGIITGIIPDADATYVMTIRATDGHGKYADNLFRMVTRDCATNPLGIKNSLKVVPNAALTGYNMYSTNQANQARLDGSTAWYGVDSSSYLQID